MKLYLSCVLGIMSSFLVLSFIQLDMNWIITKGSYGLRMLFLLGAAIQAMAVYNFLGAKKWRGE